MTTSTGVFDGNDPDGRIDGLGEAAAALLRGELVVLPTDTVYGVAADAFNPAAVNTLLRIVFVPVLEIDVGNPDPIVAIKHLAADSLPVRARSY